MINQISHLDNIVSHRFMNQISHSLVLLIYLVKKFCVQSSSRQYIMTSNKGNLWRLFNNLTLIHHNDFANTYDLAYIFGEIKTH